MAKVRPEQLEQSLKKVISPIYLITGDDTLLVQEACDTVRKQAKASGFIEREIYNVDAQFNWETILQSANSLSLFSEKKMLEVRIPNGKPGDAGSKTFVEYCQSPSTDTLLLIVLPKIDRRSQGSKWFKTIESIGDIVTVWPISTQQMPRWVEQRLQAAGIKASSDAIDILCSKTEGNLLATAQEIEKLKLLDTSTSLDAKAMASAVMSSARYDVFGLVDKALAAQAKHAVMTLNGLKGEGTEPTVLLWAIAKEIRTLAHIREAMDSGQNFDFAAKQQGVWENRKALIKQASNRLSARQLHSILRKSGAADKIIKGMEVGDIWNQLLDIILSLSGVEAFSSRTQRLSLTT